MKIMKIPKKNLMILAAFVATISVLDSTNARAGFVVTIPHVVVQPGGTGFLDVMIRSDSGDGDSLQSYFLDFFIEADGVQLVAPINFVESDMQAPQLFESIVDGADRDYVFLDDSLKAEDPVGSIDFVGNQDGLTTGPNDLITVSDETESLLDRTINDGDGEFLLARLNFEVPITAALGSVYQVSLDELFSEFVNADEDLVDFEFTKGSITIAPMFVIPEPSSIGQMAFGSFLWLWGRRRKRFQADQPLSVTD
jgi:hypothetical protein